MLGRQDLCWRYSYPGGLRAGTPNKYRGTADVGDKVGEVGLRLPREPLGAPWTNEPRKPSGAGVALATGCALVAGCAFGADRTWRSRHAWWACLSGGAGTRYSDKQSGHREGCQKHDAALRGKGDVEFQTLPDTE